MGKLVVCWGMVRGKVGCRQGLCGVLLGTGGPLLLGAGPRLLLPGSQPLLQPTPWALVPIPTVPDHRRGLPLGAHFYAQAPSSQLERSQLSWPTWLQGCGNGDHSPQAHHRPTPGQALPKLTWVWAGRRQLSHDPTVQETLIPEQGGRPGDKLPRWVCDSS